MEFQTLEAVLIQAADAISASRPGARRETLEAYIKRLEKLEGIADSFDGVDKSYAIHAGREIRIMVKPERIDDLRAAQLAREIAKKVEGDLEYPVRLRSMLFAKPGPSTTPSKRRSRLPIIKVPQGTFINLGAGFYPEAME